MKKMMVGGIFLIFGILIMNACQKERKAEGNIETILAAAAASLRNPLEDVLLPLYKEIYPDRSVIFTYDSSGKLQTQIEEGAEADLFISASEKQMNELRDAGLIKPESIVNLLQNEIVLIVPADSEIGIETFSDVLKADMIAVGDPESVPVGQYTKELFEKMGIWDQVLEKSSLGSNVTEVLSWVSDASADAGVVYATDAAADSRVRVIERAEKGQVSSIIYPAGIVASTEKEKEAHDFIEFLSSDAAGKVFEKYGFTLVQ